MNIQSQSESNYQDKHWLNVAEVVTVAGSIGGSIASVFLKEIILAVAPLSACVAFNLINRKRLLNLTTTVNNQAIATLSEHNQNDHSNICEQLLQIQQSLNNHQTRAEDEHKSVSERIEQLKINSKVQVHELNEKHDELVQKVDFLTQASVSSKSSVASSADLYCKNGDGYQKMGENQKALDEYARAIKVDSRYALAYANRGLLYSKMGDKKAAVEDLRKATKYYFEQGDIDNYQKVKNMSQNIYQVDSNSDTGDSEQVSANSLFS